MKLQVRVQWTIAEMPMPSPCVVVMFSYLAASVESNVSTLLKSMMSRQTSGYRWLWWRIRDIILVPALSTMSLFTHLEVSLEAQNKKLMTRSRSMMLTRIIGLFSRFAWKTRCGLAQHSPCRPQKLSSSEERILTETVRFICSMFRVRHGDPCIRWISCVFPTSRFSTKTKSM